MKKIHRIIAALTAILVAITCSGFASLVSASAAATVTSIKIIKYPARTEFLKGADWDFGYYDVPDNGLGTFVSGGDKVAFKHYGGYHTRYEDLGMLDMNGLVVRVTYSDGKTADIAYKETVSGPSVYQNIYASFRKKVKPGINSVEVYFKPYNGVSDFYDINLVTTATEKGDVNHDGKVNSADALIVLQHVVAIKLLNAVDYNIGDMNSDGSINSFDALLILRKAVA